MSSKFPQFDIEPEEGTLYCTLCGTELLPTEENEICSLCQSQWKI